MGTAISASTAKLLTGIFTCETGSGEARAGEAVMGLRRGFIQAGAQNLLMTLWPISDETTVQIVLDFMTRRLKAARHRKHSPRQSVIDWSSSVRSAGYLTLFGSLDHSS